METTRRGRRRPWNSFSLNWALKAVKESCCRLPSLAGSCQMNPGGGMNGSGTCMNFGKDLPAQTSRFVVGTWEVGVLFASPRSELESASVDRGHAFVSKIQDVGTYPQRLVHQARVQRRPLRTHGPCEVAKMYLLMSTSSLVMMGIVHCG